jgi:integrase
MNNKNKQKMARCSNKQVAKILASGRVVEGRAKEQDVELNRKIARVTEDFPAANKYCKLVLSDRNRLSKENALTVCDYMIAMKREINPRLTTIGTTIQFLSELSRFAGVEKRFEDMMTTRTILLSYLDSCRKPEDKDPLHKWIASYNIKCIILSRFFKWLYYPNIGDPKRRNELSKSERKPDCIMDIRQLKRKEVSCYKPSDLWSQEDDLLFLKWVTNKRDRCYHTMARDLSARPHEILNLKIKDIAFKNIGDGKQYAEVLVNGKTGTRHIPLIQSIPYIKDWLSNHPSRNNPNSPLFIGLSKNSMGRRLNTKSLYQVYKIYKEEFFPKLLEDPTISNEDKEKIKSLLAKPFNPYIRRHSALTEKSVKLKSNTLNQHAGWSMNSHMAQKYIHYFGNESSESLLEAYGIVTKNNARIDTLNPKICPNCNEGNTQDARFCAKCRIVLTYDAYSETIERQQEKDSEVQRLKEQMRLMQESQTEILALLRDPEKMSEILKHG